MYSVHLRTLDNLRFTRYQNITGQPVFYGEHQTLHGVGNKLTGDEKNKKQTNFFFNQRYYVEFIFLVT